MTRIWKVDQEEKEFLYNAIQLYAEIEEIKTKSPLVILQRVNTTRNSTQEYFLKVPEQTPNLTFLLRNGYLFIFTTFAVGLNVCYNFNST